MKTHEQFCEYLLAKSNLLQRERLDIEGRNVIIFYQPSGALDEADTDPSRATGGTEEGEEQGELEKDQQNEDMQRIESDTASLSI